MLIINIEESLSKLPLSSLLISFPKTRPSLKISPLFKMFLNKPSFASESTSPRQKQLNQVYCKNKE